MFGPVLAFLTSRAGLAVIAAALVAGVIGIQTARLGHAKHDLAALQAAEKAAAAEAKVRDREAAQISSTAGQKLTDERTKIQVRTQTLVKEVVRYVPAAADARCVVPAGFVQLHDAAAAGLPAPAGGPLSAASGVPISAVAETVVANYGTAYDWRAEVMTWRAWYADQKTAWERR